MAQAKKQQRDLNTQPEPEDVRILTPEEVRVEEHKLDAHIDPFKTYDPVIVETSNEQPAQYSPVEIAFQVTPKELENVPSLSRLMELEMALAIAHQKLQNARDTLSVVQVEYRNAQQELSDYRSKL